MKARDARQLKVGDWVTVNWPGRGGYRSKACEITEIRWPTFFLSTVDSKGREVATSRKYQSIYPCESPQRPSRRRLPFWLTWKQFES